MTDLNIPIRCSPKKITITYKHNYFLHSRFPKDALLFIFYFMRILRDLRENLYFIIPHSSHLRNA